LDPLDPSVTMAVRRPGWDGYSNWEEYEAGSDPQNPLSTPLQVVAPPFQITSVVRAGNNIVLTWNTAGGLTNQVRSPAGNRRQLFDERLHESRRTDVNRRQRYHYHNYTDVGGATNTPAATIMCGWCHSERTP